MLNFIEDITSPAIQRLLLPFKVILVPLSALAAGFLVFVHHQTRWMRISAWRSLTEFSGMKTYEETQFERDWHKVKQRLEKDWSSEAKLAIIEADKMLDATLQRMGYGGASLGDRLKQLDKDVLPNLNEIWDAHKIRNDIVHDPDYQFSNRSARIAIDAYDKAFEHLRNV